MLHDVDPPEGQDCTQVLIEADTGSCTGEGSGCLRLDVATTGCTLSNVRTDLHFGVFRRSLV